jgi:hypothetical protein
VARVEISETVARDSGHPVTGAHVYVYERGTTDQAPVYTLEVGGTVITQPLRTLQGAITGWVEEGSYDLVITWGSRTFTEPFEAVSATSIGSGTPTAASVSFTPTGSVAANNVQAAIAELAAEAAALTASAIAFSPTGSIAAANVQAAIAEVAAESVAGTSTGFIIMAAPTGVSATDTAAINTALTAASSAGGGTILGQEGTYATTGGHTLPRRTSILGMGVGATVFDHSGHNACYTHEGDTTTARYTTERAGWAHVWIKGNSGASAVGIEVRGSYGTFCTHVVIGDHTGAGGSGAYTNGIGVLLHNFTSGTWVEGFTGDHLHLLFNATGLQFKRTAGTNSFGYTKLTNFEINVPASGTGIDVGNGGQVTPYNAVFTGNIWYEGNNATGMRLRNLAAVEKGSWFHIRGEVMNASTGCVRVLFDAGATSTTVLEINGYFGSEGGGSALTDNLSGGSPIFRESGIFLPAEYATNSIPDAATAKPFTHQEHAGIGFSNDANEEATWVSGFAGAADKVIFRVVKKPFATNKNAPFDTVANQAISVDGEGDLNLHLAGGGLGVKEGSNAKMGLATLVAGTVTVSTTRVTANSRIFLSVQTAGGTQGFLRISARTAGTSFVITSTSGSETSTVAWLIVEPT